MFDLNVRIQVAAIVIFAILLVDFCRSKKLNVLSTKFFLLMLFFSAVNLVFDILSVYTISHLDTVPSIVNRIVHQFFIGSLNCLMLFLFLYIDALCKKQKRLITKRYMTIVLLPAIISLFFVIFAPLYYHVDEKAVYSYGPMAYTVSASVAFYMLYSLFDLFYFHRSFKKSNYISIIMGISIWIIATIIQMIFKQYLISGLALVSMLVILYFSYENPKEHKDEEIDSFNKAAFIMVANEIIHSKKNYYLVNVVVEDLSSINRVYGYRKGTLLMNSITRYINITYGFNVFHIRGNVITFYSYSDYSVLYEKILKLKYFLDHNIPIFENELLISRKDFDLDNYSLLMKKLKGDVEEIPALAHIDIIDKKLVSPLSIDHFLSITDFMSEKVYANETNTKIVLFDESTVREKERRETILSIVTKALKEDGFEMVYQPIYGVNDHRFSSAEALVRLKDRSTIGFISPEEFIPIIEQYGLISQLGDIIFEKVCRFIAENKADEIGIDYIEVNLSAIQCIDMTLPNRLKEIINKFGISPDFINLEITETALVDSNEKLANNMVLLREIGCSFSMDDFGTGYSNIAKMASLTYDLVKIDKSLIWPCFGDDQSEKYKAILSNVLNMIHDLKIGIVAEGVETKEQLDYLVKHNVTHIQGYYFSKPLYQNDFLAFIKDNNIINKE